MKKFDDMMHENDRFLEPSEEFGPDIVDDPAALGPAGGSSPNPMASGLGSTFGIEDIDFPSMVVGGGAGMVGGGSMGPGMMGGEEGPSPDDADQMRDMLLKQLDDDNTRSEQYQGGVVDENVALKKRADARRGGGSA